MIINDKSIVFPCSLSDLMDEGFKLSGSYNYGDIQEFNTINRQDLEDISKLKTEYYSICIYNGRYYHLFLDGDVVRGVGLSVSDQGTDSRSIVLGGIMGSSSLESIISLYGDDYYVLDSDYYTSYIWPNTKYGVLSVRMEGSSINEISLNEHIDSPMTPAGMAYCCVNFAIQSPDERIDSHNKVSATDLKLLDVFLGELMDAYRTGNEDKMASLYRYDRTSEIKESWNDELFPYQDIKGYHFSINDGNKKNEYRLIGYWVAQKRGTNELYCLSQYPVIYYDSNEPKRWSLDSYN